MSSTRRATDGQLRQERWCSSPEFDGDVINGLAAAKRIAIVNDRATRELLWWIQSLSLTPGAIQALCDELVATFPERIGTPTLRNLQKRGVDRELTEKEVDLLKQESSEYFLASLSDFIIYDDEPDYWGRRTEPKPKTHLLSEAAEVITDEIAGLKDKLVRFCLDPQAKIESGVWYFEDLAGALAIIREKRIAAARARLADTAITRKINETLDFWYARGRMILIEGAAGIGRTASARAWCDAHPGMVRYVEVPSSSDDRSFFSAIARQLGIARGASFKAQQIKVRIEEMLLGSELRLVFDESQYLWGQAMRPRKTPDRLLWVKTTFDAGTPISLIAHTDFSKWQKHFVDRTLWTDEQFERRLNRRVSLPAEHSKEDMLKIARSHFPRGDSATWKLLASYALLAEKKQASGIVEALESARYRAESAGREQPTFADIESALKQDHGFLSERPDARGQEPDCTRSAVALQARRKGPAIAPHRTAGESEFPIRLRSDRSRITAPEIPV